MDESRHRFCSVRWAILSLFLQAIPAAVLAVGYEPGDIPIAHPSAPSIERVTIPAGEFLMGSPEGTNPDEGPVHPVHLDSYEIGKFEVTWEQFQAFIDAGGYQERGSSGYWSRWGAEISEALWWTSDEQRGNPLNAPQWTPAGNGPPDFAREDRWPPKPNHPVVGVSIWEAEAFCRFVGGRLPTEAEWEKAAAWGPGATEPTLYPWGNEVSEPAPSNAFEINEGGSRIEAVDDPRFERDVTRYGVRGMGGNVTEWVADMYDPEFYGQGPGVDVPWKNPYSLLARRFDYTDAFVSHMPLGWVMRGANFMSVSRTPSYFKCTRRQSESQFHRNGTLGFRVAWDAVPHRADPPIVERTERPGAAVAIPAGNYLIGHSMGMPGSAQPAAHPQHPVCLRDFWIGEYEVTWGEYRKFIEMGGYGDPFGPRPEWWSEAGWKWRTLPPCAGNDLNYAVEQGFSIDLPGHMEMERLQFPAYRTSWKGPWINKNGLYSPPDDHPVFGLSWYEAEAFCRFVGGRLPLEVEWEVAASWNPRTGKPMQYPWGNLNSLPFDISLANSGDDPKYGGFQSSPVGMYPDGRSPFGCYDMAGNIIEWCEDWANADSYAYHPTECGTVPRTPDSLMLTLPDLVSCDPNYWPPAGIKINRGGGYDPGFLNSPAQGSRNRGGNAGDGYMFFRNYTYGFRVAWNHDPAGREENERVRPPFASGTDSPAGKKKSGKKMGGSAPGKTIDAVLKASPLTFNGAIDSPGKEIWYRVSGPVGAMTTIDLDAGAGADATNGTSPLDAVLEIRHEGIASSVKVRDDELVPTDDMNLRYYYFDPPVTQHRVPQEGYYYVKVHAYSWPAEGTQASLSDGERSYWGPNYSYRLTLTAPEVTESDPSGDGMLSAQDLLEVIEGFKSESSKRVQSDLTGDGILDGDDVFQATQLWLRLGQEIGKSFDSN